MGSITDVYRVRQDHNRSRGKFTTTHWETSLSKYPTAILKSTTGWDQILYYSCGFGRDVCCLITAAISRSYGPTQRWKGRPNDCPWRVTSLWPRGNPSLKAPPMRRSVTGCEIMLTLSCPVLCPVLWSAAPMRIMRKQTTDCRDTWRHLEKLNL